jgi:hypothetical protein
MSSVPPWSSFTLPRRGRICEIDVNIAEILMKEFRNAIRTRNSDAIAARDTDSDEPYHNLAEGDHDGESTDDDSSADLSSALSACSWPTSDSDTDSDDSEYLPEMPLDSTDEMQLDTVGDIPQILRPRPAGRLAVDLDITPFPDSFTRGHLRSLNFDFVRWNE